jgi:hypothetical protein
MLKKKSMSNIKKEKLKSYIKCVGKIMPILNAQSERDRYDEEMNHEINILLEEERKKESLFKKKSVVGNREVRKRKNEMKNILKSHTLTSPTKKQNHLKLLKTYDTNISTSRIIDEDKKLEIKLYSPSNGYDSSSKKNDLKGSIAFDNDKDILNSSFANNNRKSYNRLLKNSMKKLSYFISENRASTKYKTSINPKVNNQLHLNPIMSDRDNSTSNMKRYFNTFMNDTTTSTDAYFNTEVFDEKKKIEDNRKNDEDLLNVEVLENYRKINKHIEKERQSKFNNK